VRNLFNEITRRQAVLLAGRQISTDSLRSITAEAVPEPLRFEPPRRDHPGYL
jgi:hypothetical protein